MKGRRKGIPDTILEESTRLAARAAKAVVDDPRGQEVVAMAVGLAQRGRRRAEDVQARVMHAAGLPTRGDLDEVGKSMSRLKRKLRTLVRQLDEERKR